MRYPYNFIFAAVIIAALYVVARAIAWLIWRPIRTYSLKRKNRLLLKNCSDCVHFYQDSEYNCHCDLMTLVGICDPKCKACYRRSI